MKVKIMDYETAKAEVLAEERNPYIANERHIYDKDVLRYGEIINDESFVLSDGQNVRIRIISYNDYIYYHKMADGEIVDFKPIGLVLK